MTASNLIMEKLDEIKELTNSELALIDQLSVKVLPDKVVNQSERLKGAFINPVTSVNGLPKYLAIRLEAINEILKEIQTNWNNTLPEATTNIDNIQNKLDELYNGVNEEYNTLLKIENAIKKEISDREQAITDLINGASEDFNTLQEIETKVKQEISDREQAITNLINGASGDYDTLKELETAIKNEVTARSQAITDLINGASSGYDTLKELETAIKKEVTDREQAITDLINNATANYNTLGKLENRIKEETANRNNAISALKGTATSSNDTLGKLETNLNNEISNREDAIEALVNNASSGYQTLKELEDKIKAEVTARTQAITKEINDRNSAIQTAISNLVDTAPDLLNTLDELAAALGDDPNFATTVANNIAQSLTTAKAYTDTKISEEVSARNTAISGAISNLKGTATTNYDTLAKLEARIKEEVTNRTSAINSLIGGATESYNTLKELEDAIKAEVTNRTEAISDLIGTANSSYDTLGKIQARIEAISGTEGEGLTIEGAITTSMNYTDEKVAEETSARNNAINSLKNGASSGYDTLKELEDAIKAETSARNSAITTLKNNASSGYDTLGELESAIKAEASTRASAITQEVSDRNSAITTAINNLKGTAESGYDTLGELQNAITNQKTALENSISQAKTEVKNELLGGAGAAFDTLNELAEALGNDPNFATTVSNLIAQKQNKLTETQLNAVNSGITQAKVAKYDGYETTINNKANASEVVKKSGDTITGVLKIENSGSDKIVLNHTGDSGTAITFQENGVSQVAILKNKGDNTLKIYDNVSAMSYNIATEQFVDSNYLKRQPEVSTSDDDYMGECSVRPSTGDGINHVLLNLKGTDGGSECQIKVSDNNGPKLDIRYGYNSEPNGDFIRMASVNDLNNYMPKTGGTFTGDVTISDKEGSGEGVKLIIGDDAYICDIDKTNVIGLKSSTDSAQGGIKFGNGGILGYFGNGLTYDGAKLATEKYVSNNYLPLSGGTLTDRLNIKGNNENGVLRIHYGSNPNEASIGFFKDGTCKKTLGISHQINDELGYYDNAGDNTWHKLASQEWVNGKSFARLQKIWEGNSTTVYGSNISIQLEQNDIYICVLYDETKKQYYNAYLTYDDVEYHLVVISTGRSPAWTFTIESATVWLDTYSNRFQITKQQNSVKIMSSSEVFSSTFAPKFQKIYVIR